MSENILESYFIRVGALPDTASFRRLGFALKDATHLINGFSLTGIKSILALEVATVGAFSAIGLGLIGLADKTAMTDQSYRLMGMRMLMTKNSARAMQTALDELGATIDEVAYDPELNKRFQYLYEQNIKMGKTMGEGYDKNMRSIRDLREEYKRFGTEFEYMVAGSVSKLFEKLGFGNNEVLGKLDQLNDWFTDNGPHIADVISDNLIPVWKDFVDVTSDAGDTFKQAAGEFTFLIGELSGDKSIQDTTFDLDHLATAVHHVIDAFAAGGLSFGLFLKTMGHAGAATAATFGSAYYSLTGNTKEANRLAGIEGTEEGKAENNVKNLFGFGDWKSNPDFAGMLAHENSVNNRGKDSATSPNYAGLLDDAGKKYNINPELLSALIQQESGWDAGAKSGAGAKGLMQLMPGTAKQYGVKNSLNPAENIDGGAHYLSDLLTKYKGDTTLALREYNAGSVAMGKYGNNPPFHETQDYVQKVLRNFIKLNDESQANGGAVIIHSVTINVPHALPQDKWKDFVKESMTDIKVKDTRNVTAQTAAGAYY